MADKQTRLRRPPPNLRIAHLAWLYCKAGMSGFHVREALSNMVTQTMYRRMQSSSGYEKERDPIKRMDYERRAKVQLSMIHEGRMDELPELTNDEVMYASYFCDQHDVKRYTASDGTEVSEDQIVGEAMTDPKATIKAAEKKGAGPSKSIEEIASLLNAESLVVMTKMGPTYIPIPADAKRNEDGGVHLAGQDWDKSFIVPDRDARAKGLSLAKAILGISDAEQIRMLKDRIHTVKMGLDLDWNERKRREQIAVEQQKELDKSKEIKEVGNTKRITMVRPKMIAAEDWNKEQGGEALS